MATIKYLVEYGTDVNCTGGKGQTPACDAEAGTPLYLLSLLKN